MKNQYKIYLQIGLSVLAAFLGYRIFKFLKDAKDSASSAAQGIVKDIKNSAQVNTIKTVLNNAGIDDVRESFITDCAEEIYNALHKDSFFGFGEDEEKATDFFNSCQSVSEAKAVAGVYKANFKKSLYSEFKSYFSVSQMQQLKTSFLTGIKSL